MSLLLFPLAETLRILHSVFCHGPCLLFEWAQSDISTAFWYVNAGNGQRVCSTGSGLNPVSRGFMLLAHCIWTARLIRSLAHCVFFWES